MITRSDLLGGSSSSKCRQFLRPSDLRPRKFGAGVDDARPYLLGLVLDGVAHALSNALTPCSASRNTAWPTSKGGEQPGGPPAFGWSPDEFTLAYDANVEGAEAIALESSPVVPARRALLKATAGVWPKVGETKGCQALLMDLENLYNGSNFKAMPGWPARAHPRLHPATPGPQFTPYGG